MRRKPWFKTTLEMNGVLSPFWGVELIFNIHGRSYISRGSVLVSVQEQVLARSHARVRGVRARA